MRKQFNIKHDVIATALASSVQRGTSARWYEPLATGQMDVAEWLRWVDKQEVYRQDGSSYPAIYSLMGGGAYAVSEVSRRLWAASKAGCLPYAQAVHQGEAFRGLVESVTHSFAAQLGRAVPEVTAANVRIKTQQQEADAPRNMGEEIREAAQHYREQLDAGRITQHEYQLAMRELVEVAKEARWAKEAQGNAVMSSDHGNPAEDEGSVQVALHKVSELWNYKTKDILGAETSMVEALHSFKGVELPIDDPEWDWVTERLAESWALSLEYAKDDIERADLQRKIEYRAEIAEKGINSMPWKARWAVNHIARRVWRDRVSLKRKLDGWERKIGSIGERMAREEKYNLPAIATRMISEQPGTDNEDGTPRTYFLVWDVVKESDIAPQISSVYEEAEYVEQHNGNVTREVSRTHQVRLNQGEYEILVTQALIERGEAILEKMDRLYTKVREVDLALTPIWQEMFDPEASVVMPEHPPVYWNQRGFYTTEEEAMAAIAAEDAERKERTLDGIQSLMEQMLQAQGWAK